MKTPFQLRAVVLAIAFVTGFIVSCDKNHPLPIDDFYRFNTISRLVIQKPLKKNYILGVDTDAVQLSVKATEENGQIIEIPNKAVRYFSNGAKLTGESFIPEKPGIFRFVGKLADQVSDTLQLRVWDSAALSIRISVIDNPTREIVANGTDTIRFKAELLHGKEIIEGNFPINIYVNDRETPGTFSTATPGNYKVTAKGLGLISNEITVTAISVPAYKLVRLPVIFHEINTRKLTPQTVKEMTQAMTKAFRNKLNLSNMPQDVRATDIYVEFYPAEMGLDGTPLTSPGLDRVTSAKTTFTIEDIFLDAFNSYWDPRHYLNVWVYPNITGEYAKSSWAYQPYVTVPLEGLSVAPKSLEPNKFAFGVFLNGNHLAVAEEVLAHETGPLLGLAHVFDGNGDDLNSCSTFDPDYCSDTPYYDRKAYLKSNLSDLTKRYNRVSCTGEGYTSTNFMDYYYSYTNSFTLDQAKRVRHAINYALWLPTSFNGFQNMRTSSTVLSKIKRPEYVEFVKPVICNLP